MKFVLIISILLLISCKEGSNKRQLEFENYYKALPLLSPPLEFNNGLQYKWEYQKMRDDSLSKQLASLNSEYKKMFFPSETYNSVNGRIFSEKDFISIIYRSDAEQIVPVLFTFTKEGDKIDSISLNNAIWINILGTESSHTKIDTNGEILLSDTAWFDDRDSLGVTSNIAFTVIKTEKYHLLDNGKIKRDSNKCDTIK